MQDLPSDTEIWWARHEAVGKVQARYLYILAIACLFYGMVWHETVRGQLTPGLHPGLVDVPILKFQLDSLSLLRTAPMVLGLTLLAVMGSLNAWGLSADRLEALRGDVERVAFDKTPNFLDMIMYAPPGGGAVAAFTWGVYPLLLVGAFLEGCALAYVGFTARVAQATGWEIGILSLGSGALVLSIPRLVKFVCRRSQRAWHALFPECEKNAERKKEMTDHIHDEFRHYRQTGVAYSVTLITLSSGLVVWCNSLLGRREPLVESSQRILCAVILCLAGATIIFSLCLQLFNYFGYKHQARALINQGAQTEATRWFDRQDWAIKAATTSFLLSLLSAISLFWWRF